MLRWPEGEERVFAAVHTCLPRVVARRCTPPTAMLCDSHSLRRRGSAQLPWPKAREQTWPTHGRRACLQAAASAGCSRRGRPFSPSSNGAGMKQPAGLPLSWFSRQNTGQEQTCVLLVKPGVRGLCVRSHKLIQ